MSTYLGNTLISGVGRHTESNAHTLLDFKWSDHIINSMEWLRSDTFSWQSGVVYQAVYNHLVADLVDATPSVETIGDYSLTVYTATDGHKIVLDDEESTVINIFNSTGIAWYYIVDTTNTRFKLPRKHSTQVVQSVNNADGSWYRLYADGWVKQGGRVTYSTDGNFTINFPIKMSNTSYLAQITLYGDTSVYSSAVNGHYFGCWNLTTTSMDTRRYSSQNVQQMWEVNGVSAIDMSSFQANEKYLYFYVGQYTQSAIEQTAGITSEELNAKADVGSVDGSWHFNKNLLTNSTAVGSYEIDLSSYLPNDGKEYEVIITGECYSASSSYSVLTIESDIYPNVCLANVGSNARVFIFNQIIVVGPQRKLTLKINQTAVTWENMLGQQGMYAVGYKRVSNY